MRAYRETERAAVDNVRQRAAASMSCWQLPEAQTGRSNNLCSPLYSVSLGVWSCYLPLVTSRMYRMTDGNNTAITSRMINNEPILGEILLMD